MSKLNSESIPSRCLDCRQRLPVPEAQTRRPYIHPVERVPRMGLDCARSALQRGIEAVETTIHQVVVISGEGVAARVAFRREGWPSLVTHVRCLRGPRPFMKELSHPL